MIRRLVQGYITRKEIDIDVIAGLEKNCTKSAIKTAEKYLVDEESVQGDHISKALKLITASAAKGDHESQYTLGKFYEYGLKDFELDVEKAKEYFKLAATQGNPKAQVKLASYIGEEDTEKAKEKALELYALAARAGDVNGKINLARYIREGIGTKEDAEKAFEIVVDASQTQHPTALVELGRCYEMGLGVVADLKRAKECYTVLHMKGYLQGTYQLGRLYYFGAPGTGLGKHRRKGFELFLEAKGYAQSCYYLGHAYEHGYGTDKDLQKAFEYYSEAHQDGDFNGLAEMGRFLLYGVHGTTNVELGLQHIAFAFDNGSAAGAAYLGKCYYNGLGVTKDWKTAFELFEFASENGFTGAFYDLAVCYEKGHGVNIDQEKASRFHAAAYSTKLMGYRTSFKETFEIFMDLVKKDIFKKVLKKE